MFWTLFLAFCLDGNFVSPSGCSPGNEHFERLGEPLPHHQRGVGGLHRQVWGPLGRPADVGCPSSVGDHRSLCSCSTTRWNYTQCNPGFSNRTGIQVGEKDFEYQSWGRLGFMGGSGPMEHCYYNTAFKDYQFIIAGNDYNCLGKGKEIKDDTGVGPGGRLGVCGRDGDGEIGMASESHHLDRLSPSGGGGANVRTGKCPPQKGSNARFGAIHGLRCVGAIWCQSPQSLEVSIFHHDCGRVRDQGASRARLFSAVEIVRVFLTACLMLNLADQAILHAYEMFIERLTRQYPGAWHLIYQADDQARNSHITRMRTVALLEIRNGGTPPKLWEATRPWNAMFRQLPFEEDFWREQVHGPALAWLAHGGRGKPQTPAEAFAIGHLRDGLNAVRPEVERSHGEEDGGEPVKKNVNKARREARKRRIAAEREELEKYRKHSGGDKKGGHAPRGQKGDGKGPQKCFGWNNGNGPCANLAPGQQCVSKVKREQNLHDLRFTWASQQGLPAEEMNLAGILTKLFVMSWRAKVRGRGDEGEPGRGEEREDRRRRRDDPPQEGRKRRPDRGEEDGREEDEDEREENLSKKQKDDRDLEDYTANRAFLFIHHFSGARGDRLGRAIKAEAERMRMRVKVIGVDKESDGNDLSWDQPYTEHLRMASEGLVDGFHAGFPCSTFSRLRWREAPNLPGPVRSKSHPYGLPGNTPAQQKECDVGTVVLARSVDMAVEVEAHRSSLLAVGPFSTLENPPESNVEEHISAWEMKEMEKYLEIPGVRNANFHTCIYQSEVAEGERSLKPQRFAGSLLGLQDFSGFCKCSEGARHLKIVGKERSSAAAEYPFDLCEKYAKAAIQHFRLMAKQEFWEEKRKAVEEEVEELRKKEKKGIKRKAEESRVDDEEHFNPSGTATSSSTRRAEPWRGGDGKFEMMRDNLRRTEKVTNQDFVGGMRDPAKVVDDHPTMANWGIEVWKTWTEFVKDHDRALQVAKSYGTKGCTFERDIVERWREELTNLVGAKREVPLRAPGSYVSPLYASILENWSRKAGDPESEVPDWIREGAPLGISRGIRSCGIFPKVDSEEAKKQELLSSAELADAEAQLSRGDVLNYSSVEQDKEEAAIELNRYKELGYTRTHTKREVLEKYAHGTVSRLALIVKTREDGSKKRRIIIDLRRSGGNQKSVLPEKLVLPRPKDAVSMIRDMYDRIEDKSQVQLELTVIDVSDAFMALPVHPDEHQHTLAPGFEEGTLVTFVALLFGFKVAPLLWSRVASLLARLLQAAVERKHGQHQCYLDDAMWCLCGDLQRRNTTLAFILTTMAALGFKVALEKGERANALTWIGVRLAILEQQFLAVTLPEKFMEDLINLVSSWNEGMAPVKELRKAAGKLSWLAGILPRARWVVRVFYGALHGHEKDVMSGKEESRRVNREDVRKKDHLFAMKRIVLARRWLLEYLKVAKDRPVRRYRLLRNARPIATITTDASPEGLGGLLFINNKLIAIFSTKVTKEDCEKLDIPFGESASQGPLEAYALLQAIALWKHRLFNTSVCLTLESDSTVALAMAEKVSGKSPALNYIGAELGILLEEAGIEEVKCRHIPGTANEYADYLSRPSKWLKYPKPKELAEMTLQKIERRYQRLPAPCDEPELWGSSAAATEAWTSIRAWSTARRSSRKIAASPSRMEGGLWSNVRGVYKFCLVPWGFGFTSFSVKPLGPFAAV